MMKDIRKTILSSLRLSCMVTTLGLILFSVVCFASPSETGQRVFASPELALQELTAAVKAKDHTALRAILGPVTKDLEPGDPVEQAAEFEQFAGDLLERTELVKEGDSKAILII